MTKVRLNDTKLPLATIEAIAVKYRFNHHTGLLEPMKGFTDFETLHRYEIVTAESKTRLTYHVARIRSRSQTTLEYDFTRDRINVVVSEALYERLALFEPSASYYLARELANLLLLYLSADAYRPPLRTTAYSHFSEEVHPQAGLLAAAILAPLLGVAALAPRVPTLTTRVIGSRWDMPPALAGERLASFRRMDETFCEDVSATEPPVTIQASHDNTRWWRALTVLEGSKFVG